ncbi:MAG: fibronectin type III domain-containing protein [Longimicrobiales bacterium]|nr:fibronectin type III domain-containing protein [Longimicrobiales bacterium]
MFSRGRLIPLMAALAVSVAACSDDDNGGTNVQDPPAQPTGVAVAEGDGVLVVSWTAVSGATAYDVQRQEAVGGASFSDIAMDVTETTYTDATAVEGTTYNYRVIAKNVNGSSTPSDPAPGLLDPNTQVLSGTINSDVTLDANLTYTITGIVTVEDGASLTIPAGTLLLGSTAVQPSALMVRTGGQIFSNGTVDDPVVFTSAAPEGSRERGDWGGVVINGLSICNFPADECVGEGASGPYGGNQLDDDSGSMTYTRVEFAGYEVSFGNELNALTLNGVGSGTTLEAIQTHYGSDDGFEFFGGTVDLKWAIATGISDDSFDYSTGWQGRGQFWIAQQDPDDADNGFEVDGNEDNFDATPLTDPIIYNVTLVGKGVDGVGGTAGESVDGLRLRRGTGGDIFNAIVIGFGTSGVDVDNIETVGRYTVQNSIIALNAANIKPADDEGDTVAYQDSVSTVTAWNNIVGTDPLLTDPFNRTAPDFRPGAGSPALVTEGNGATPPADGFFDVTATYIGAVDPDAATQWFEGWTTLAQN